MKRTTPFVCALVPVFSWVLVTCTQTPKKMPAVDGAIIEVRRSDSAIDVGEPGFDSTLQLYWLGTACHLIQLGHAQVLTDPFVTNRLRLNNLVSDPARVDVTLGRIPVPDAVIINHSHHDHILDAYGAMTQSAWANVPLYGSVSAKNLLAGWQQPSITTRCHEITVSGQAFSPSTNAPGYRITITPYLSKHAPHLKCGLTFLNGKITSPRTSPPSSVFDFQCGEVYNYLIDIRSPAKSFKVFYLGAPYDLEELPNSVPDNVAVDVVLALAPSAGNVPGYPQQHLGRLKPRHVVLSHFNSFTKEDPDAMGMPKSDIPGLSRAIQSTFSSNPRFEKLHIPAITILEPNKKARNVIQIH
ncbi:MAG: MBL fold metallo-hydrolase [Verrucomicrobiaceae bacterium]|nr:MBL fold metallo-hydrolase [Verrucomicrobiaceae bacterium]